MIQIIAFSFNRAMQLDTLLSSLISKWKAPAYQIDVVYNYTTPEYGKGYEMLISNYVGKNVTLYKESSKKTDKISLIELMRRDNLAKYWKNPRLRKPKTNFRSLLIELMEQSEAKNVMFLTDDSMFVSEVEISHNELDWINENPIDRQFSLRLGQGISTLPKTIRLVGTYCCWNMYENKGNWGYPFSVDSHIYNKEAIIRLFKKYIFTNPSTLEADIVSVVGRKKYFAESRCFSDIKMLTFPINIVQDAVDNLSQDVSGKMLNQRYLRGERLKYVVDKEYNATKQYVKEIEFTDKEGNTSILGISDELIKESPIIDPIHLP